MSVKNLYHVKLNRDIEVPWVETSQFFFFLVVYSACQHVTDTM